DAEVDDTGLLAGARGLDGGPDLLALRHAQADEIVGLGELHEIRALDRRRHVAAAVEELLPLAHHAEVAVVDDGDVDLDVLLRAGRQLTRRHLEAAVARDDPDLVVGTGEARAHRGRQREAHRAQTARGEQLPRVIVFVVLGLPHLVLAYV